MLRGIPSTISSDLLKAMADMGHGDLIVVADHFYPPYSKSPQARSIQAKGMNCATLIGDMLKLFPLDADFSEYPVLCMVPDGSGKEALMDQTAAQDVIEKVIENGYSESSIGAIERTKFYDLAAQAFATVCTSEQEPYGCFILKKGVN